MLEKIFIQLVSKYRDDTKANLVLWNAISKKYNSNLRYYHNIKHLEQIYSRLLLVKNKIQNWDVVLFSLFYHDYIYSVLITTNEAKSAKEAVLVMSDLGIANSDIKACKAMILATRGHSVSDSSDINYFTDADLSILGQEWELYDNYRKNVRKEYNIYPNSVYTKGRIKVLHELSKHSKIFKTEPFFTLYNAQAKNNITKEIQLLSETL
ncbi:hypothetical protein ACE939_12070 [Aquimarina sp. W85]|uniref:HD domain-containing protein n=1 Tax=Aquimarina rhodophyticola TaxID=3342246 RepID=UPI00366D93C4